MRLTGGQAKGRRLRAPRGVAIRPTADRVREALFDILGARIVNARFLDVYAGTGAVGCEALSRGAARVVFLERDRTALGLIADNLEIAACRAGAEVLTGDARAGLLDLERAGERFDIVFLDPPYDDAVPEAVARLAARLIRPGGVMIVEHRSSGAIETPPGAQPFRSYRYGDTALTVCRVPEDIPPA